MRKHRGPRFHQPPRGQANVPGRGNRAFPAPGNQRRPKSQDFGRVRIVIWHGYLLGGTGSNVYTRALAREWARTGHDVTVVCQERAPERYDLGGARVVRPELPGRLLPVFVLDRYEGLEPRLLQTLTASERRAYVEANASTLREHLPADALLTNHVLPGAAVGAAAGHAFGVKVHGSEL